MKRENCSTEILLTNARLILPDRQLNQACLTFYDGVITGIYPAEELALIKYDDTCHDVEVLDVQGDYITPGLIDLHVHGCAGADVMDADESALARMATALLQQGTTAFLATTMTAPPEQIATVIAGTVPQSAETCAAELLGFHLEGPCLSPRYRGAQNLTTTLAPVTPINANVKLITLAPELAEAEPYFTLAQKQDLILSAGHSAASYEQMQLAIERGIRYLTHAFNAMPGIHHREPGLLTAALLDYRLTIELIADEIHIHPAVLELALRLKSLENVVLVSDGTRAVGLPDGYYELGGQTAQLSNGKMSLADGTIAGSAKPLLAGVWLLVKSVGRPLFEAVRLATLNPARIAKIDHRIGSLAVGKEATLLRLDENLALKQVWQRGLLKKIFEKPLETV